MKARLLFFHGRATRIWHIRTLAMVRLHNICPPASAAIAERTRGYFSQRTSITTVDPRLTVKHQKFWRWQTRFNKCPGRNISAIDVLDVRSPSVSTTISGRQSGVIISTYFILYSSMAKDNQLDEKHRGEGRGRKNSCPFCLRPSCSLV